MADLELRAAVTPVEAAVAVAVIGEDPFDGDAALREPRDGAVEERDAVRRVLTAGELAVRESGVRVDRSMDMGVATTTRTRRCAATKLLMAASVRDTSEFLHVDMDQLAAAGGLDPADHSTGWAVHPPQPVHAVTDQHAMHRRRRDPNDPGESRRSELSRLT